VTIPYQVSLPAKLLKTAERDAVLIMRLGAIANALQTVLMSGRAEEHTNPMVAARDRLHRALIVASYIREVEHIVDGDKSHKGRLWELVTGGVKAHQQIPAEIVEECKQLLSKRGPLLGHLTNLRDFVGFHVLPREFREWLKKQADETRIHLQCVPDPLKPDVVFLASAEAITAAYVSDDKSREFLEMAYSLARTLPYLFEAAVLGLLHEHGIDSAQALAINAQAFMDAKVNWGLPTK
jgi:hypothetical protein